MKKLCFLLLPLAHLTSCEKQEIAPQVQSEIEYSTPKDLDESASKEKIAETGEAIEQQNVKESFE